MTRRGLDRRCLQKGFHILWLSAFSGDGSSEQVLETWLKKLPIANFGLRWIRHRNAGDSFFGGFFIYSRKTSWKWVRINAAGTLSFYQAAAKIMKDQLLAEHSLHLISHAHQSTKFLRAYAWAKLRLNAPKTLSWAWPLGSEYNTICPALQSLIGQCLHDRLCETWSKLLSRQFRGMLEDPQAQQRAF